MAKKKMSNEQRMTEKCNDYYEQLRKQSQELSVAKMELRNLKNALEDATSSLNAALRELGEEKALNTKLSGQVEGLYQRVLLLGMSVEEARAVANFWRQQAEGSIHTTLRRGRARATKGSVYSRFRDVMIDMAASGKKEADLKAYVQRGQCIDMNEFDDLCRAAVEHGLYIAANGIAKIRTEEPAKTKSPERAEPANTPGSKNEKDAA